jgi:twitching motility protein PilT
MIVSPVLKKILQLCIDHGFSDIHISANSPLISRHDGLLKPIDREDVWDEERVRELADSCLSPDELDTLKEKLSLDVACSLGNVRFRINIFRERGYLAFAIRMLNATIPALADLDLPASLADLTKFKNGLVLFTGPTGSGKSTSLASLIDLINRNRACHILTIEDPIEYLHTNKRSLVRQRELGPDVRGFAVSLREALREDPDVILVGEMRDLDTIRAAVTAAETGHLVFSTLHTSDTIGAMDRILSMYPPIEQDAVRRQLAMILKAVVAQTLLPRRDGGRVAAVEILRVTSGVSNLIRTAQFQQINSALETGVSHGMQSFDMHLAKLAARRLVEDEVARGRANNIDFFEQCLINARNPLAPKSDARQAQQTSALQSRYNRS